MRDPLDAVRDAIPSAAADSIELIQEGWDSVVADVGGEWIVRVARTDAVAAAYEAERRLLPQLARVLPAAVPVPIDAGRDYIVYPKLRGSPLTQTPPSEATGVDLGKFLRQLHMLPVSIAEQAGLQPYAREHELAVLQSVVLPRLDPEERSAAEALLTAAAALEFNPAIVHADLGPAHILCNGPRLAGVIDWTDARIDDPAIDLAWLLHGAPAPAAEAARNAYGADAATTARALVHHQLGPWHEVLHGVTTATPALVNSGLAGVRARLGTNAD